MSSGCGKGQAFVTAQGDGEAWQAQHRAHELQPYALQGSQNAIATLSVELGWQACLRAVGGEDDGIGFEKQVPGAQQLVPASKGVQKVWHIRQALFGDPVRDEVGETWVPDLLENRHKADPEVG